MAARIFAAVRRSPEHDGPTSHEHYGKVYEIVREHGGRFWLRKPDGQLNVHSDQMLNVGALAFGLGDHVRLTDGRRAEIIDCVWHYKRQQPMYFLAFDGKKSSRRYFPDELAVAE